MKFHLLYLSVFALLIIGKSLEHEQQPIKHKVSWPHDTTKTPTWKDPKCLKQINDRYDID